VQHKGVPEADMLLARDRNMPIATCTQITSVGRVLYDGFVPLKISKKAKLTVLRAQNLSPLPWLLHGFSTRPGGFSHLPQKGDLNLGFTKDDSQAVVERNRSAFLEEIQASNVRRQAKRNSASLYPLVTLRQIHSDIIHRIDGVPHEQLAGDGMLTATPGLLVAIQTADCFPIILVDRKQRAVGVFHAGWRGTVKRIVEKGGGEMFRHFGSRPRDFEAAIGPGIQSCCYEVGEDVRTDFESQFEYASDLFHEVQESDPVREKYPLLFLNARAPGHGELPPKIFLDIAEANRRQLLAVGVPAERIEVCPLCTKCNPHLLFSYRGEKGKTGRQMAVAGIRA
jgi:polyphenol oxidase